VRRANGTGGLADAAAAPFNERAKMNRLLTIVMLLLMTSLSCGADRPRTRFTKQVDVFGLRVFATDTTGDDKLLHAANILAEYIDNDEDGVPDNPKIMQALINGKGAIVMRKTERERIAGPRPQGQGLYAEETIPNANVQNRFDASLEEVLHMVTDVGWAGAYPEVFGREPGT